MLPVLPCCWCCQCCCCCWCCAGDAADGTGITGITLCRWASAVLLVLLVLLLLRQYHQQHQKHQYHRRQHWQRAGCAAGAAGLIQNGGFAYHTVWKVILGVVEPWYTLHTYLMYKRLQKTKKTKKQLYFASILIFQSKKCWRQNRLCLAPTYVFASMSCLTTKLVYLQYPLSSNLDNKSYITSATIQSTSIGVVTGWQDIHHCVAAQRQIRVIYPHPHPIMCIPCETWERGQITELVACPDIGILFRPLETSVV